jgi:predicted lipoprotein
MSSPSTSAAARRTTPNRRNIIIGAAGIVLVIAMALDTKVVRIDSPANAQPGVFSAATYGASEFPKVQAAIAQRAVSAATLAAAIAKDPAAAAKQYGVPTGTGPEFSIKFTGVVGTGDLGTYNVAVAGVPKSVTIQVQTGPAIIGTDLRDATGTISFGQFTNQIEYQNAGAALNTEMKKDVLAKIDAANLKGKTISVVGAFALSDPKTWVVAPAKLDVQ